MNLQGDSGLEAVSKFLSRVTRFPLVANACDANQIVRLVKFIACQVTAAPAGNDEFSQTTSDGTTDTRLMRLNLQSIQNEFHAFTNQRIF